MRPLVVTLCHGSEGVVHQVAAIQTYTWTADVLADQGHRWLQTLSVQGKGVPGVDTFLPLLPFRVHEMRAASLLDPLASVPIPPLEKILLHLVL